MRVRSTDHIGFARDGGFDDCLIFWIADDWEGKRLSRDFRSNSREVLTIALNGIARKRPTRLDAGTMQAASYFTEKERADDQNVLFALLYMAKGLPRHAFRGAGCPHQEMGFTKNVHPI